MDKRRFVISIVLTAIFLLTFVLGLIPVYPFGTYERIGDVITPQLTLLTKIPVYPLIIFYTFLDKINLPGEEIELFYLVIAGIVIIMYYYFLSKIIIYFIILFLNFVRSKNGKK